MATRSSSRPLDATRYLSMTLLAVVLAGALWRGLAANIWSVRYLRAVTASGLDTTPYIEAPPPQHSFADYWRARQLIAEGELDAAEQQLDPLLMTEDREALRLLAELRVSEGDTDGAIAAWKAGGNANALLEYGAAARDDGQVATALQAFNAVLEIEPNNGQAAINAAELYAAQNEWDLALPLYQRAVEIDGRVIPWRMRYAFQLREAGRYAEAIEQYNQALNGSRDEAGVYFQLAWTYQLNGQFSEAVAMLEQALAAEPGQTATFWVRAGLIYEDAGRPADARAAYQEALVLEPDNAVAARRLERLPQE